MMRHLALLSASIPLGLVTAFLAHKDIISPFQVALLGLLVILAFVSISRSEESKKPDPRSIPGLKPSDPALGNLGDMGKAGSLHEFLVELHRKYGAVVSFWWADKQVISVGTPSALQDTRQLYDRPKSLFALFEPLIGSQSLQYANGGDAMARRKHFNPAFCLDYLQRCYSALIEGVALLSADWAVYGANGQPLSLHTSLVGYAVDAVAETSFGNMLDTDDKRILHDNYDNCWSEMEQRLAGSMPGDDDAGRARDARFKASLAAMHDVVRRVLQRCRDAGMGMGEGQLQKNSASLVELLLRSGYCEEQVLDDAMTYLVGGFHTTGNLLTWVFYYLAAHEEVQERVRQELSATLGEGHVTPLLDTKLPYLKAVLNESLRCSVLAPWAARVSKEAVTVQGYTVAPETPIIQALGCVLQDPEVWPEPAVFDPDRFFKPAEEEYPRSARCRNAFLPFGFAGGRVCPGRSDAYSKATLVVGSLISRFHLKLAPGTSSDVVKEYGLVTKPKDEVFVVVQAL